jgi:hypothetical protein
LFCDKKIIEHGPSASLELQNIPFALSWGEADHFPMPFILYCAMVQG